MSIRFALALGLGTLFGALLGVLPAAAAEGARHVSGRAWLPHGAEVSAGAVLQATALGLEGRVLGETRAPLAESGRPSDFALRVPPLHGARLRVAIVREGRALWQAAPVTITAGLGDLDLGAIHLSRFLPMGLGSELICPDGRASVGFARGAMVLETGGRVVTLDRVAESDPTVFAASGARLSLTLAGDRVQLERYRRPTQDCRLLPKPQSADWRAHGHAPGWRIDQSGARLTVEAETLAAPLVVDRPVPVARDGQIRFEVPQAGFVLRLEPGLCRDEAGALPYPQRVAVTINETVLEGCGGAPLELVAGPVWRVHALDGAALVRGIEVWFTIDRDGTVSGSTGCNRFNGKATIRNDRLVLEGITASRLACAPEAQAQDRRFLKALTRVEGFDRRGRDGLVLTGAGRAILRAETRRP